jgi:hypothetical protein
MEAAMSTHTIVVFPDTNLFLHYRPINEIDWCALVQARPVEIKIAAVVTRELEEQRVVHQSRRIRERAGSAVKLLQRLSVPPKYSNRSAIIEVDRLSFAP